jgi:glucose/arabinose dehydrogenase
MFIRSTRTRSPPWNHIMLRAHLVAWFALLAVPFGTASAYPPNFVDELVLSGLQGPTCLLPIPDGRMLVGQRDGRILVMRDGTVGTAIDFAVETFEEQGLLGMALDPGFPTQPHVYVLYTPFTGSTINNTHRISRLRLNGNTLDQETVLFSGLPTGNGYHVGGGLRTSPTGHLLAAIGDNGGSGHSRNLARLEGKMIRLTLSGAIPSDNPFVGQAGVRGEIYHLGFRNPFRFALRPGTNTPYVCDVGAEAWEEIDMAPPGADFGWPTYEGPVDPAPNGITNPDYSYGYSGGAAIAGCAFYTAAQFPAEYQGNLFFVDHVRGHFSRAVLDGSGHITSVNRTWGITTTSGWGSGPVELALGSDGALYYTTYSPGTVRRVRYITPVGVGSDLHGPLQLEPNVPNPFHGSTAIGLSIAQPGPVRVEIFDAGGRRVATLLDEHLDAGHHTAVWEGRLASGDDAAPGIYLCRLEAAGRILWRRMVRVR